jgi:hypothetical protein
VSSTSGGKGNILIDRQTSLSKEKRRWRYQNNSDYISKISLKVLQYDLKFKLLNEFKSINEAGRLTGISIPNISNACNGKLKHTGFFIWRLNLRV